MKTMKTLDDKRIIRVSDEKAAELYHNMEAKYIPKSVWKESVRDIESKLNDEVQDEKLISKKSNEMSKAQKRHLRKTNK